MKKIIFSLIALVACMSIHAQYVIVYKDGDMVAKYTSAKVDSVVWNTKGAAIIYKDKEIVATYSTIDADSVVFAKTIPTTGIKDGHAWIQMWEDGPMWATCNLEATDDLETDYGQYYKWGATTSWSTQSKSTTDIQGKTDDTATYLWGENWQMPSKADFDALVANCDCEWISKYNGVKMKGFLFTGKGNFSSNKLFFRASGCRETGNTFSSQDSDIYYWSSTPNGTGYAYILRANSYNPEVFSIDISSFLACPVRAIRK